jgi:hypothetical protein
MDGRGDNGSRPDETRLGRDRELQVAEASALAETSTVVADGHAARDDEVDGLELRDVDRQRRARRPLDRRRLARRVARRAGSSRKNGFSSASRGTAMNNVLPSSSARWRTGHCGESGFALTVRARCHAGTLRRRSAAASAPTKFGIRPSTPGNRATLAVRSAVQTCSRSRALPVSNAASPPASASWRRDTLAAAATRTPRWNGV